VGLVFESSRRQRSAQRRLRHGKTPDPEAAATRTTHPPRCRGTEEAYRAGSIEKPRGKRPGLPRAHRAGVVQRRT